MIRCLKFSGMTKLKADKGWIGLKDVDLYPYADGTGIAIWLWPDTGSRTKPLVLDCVGPHGLEDVAKLVQFLQDALHNCKTPTALTHDQQIQADTWMGVLAEHYEDARDLAQACASDLGLHDAEGETALADALYDMARYYLALKEQV